MLLGLLAESLKNSCSFCELHLYSIIGDSAIIPSSRTTKGASAMYDDLNGNHYETPEHDENYYADLYEDDNE
jgi:hypothetical protein